MERIWYDHRTDNRYTYDDKGFGETLFKIAAPEQVRSLIYSPVQGGKKLMAWNYAPPRVEREVEGGLYSDEEFGGYAVDSLISLSDAELREESPVYEYSEQDFKICLRIADELLLSDKPIAIILPKGTERDMRKYAEVLLKLTLHMFSREYANTVGFISFMTNSNIENWLANVRERFSVNIRLIFKYGNIFEDKSIVSVELNEAFKEKTLETKYLGVLEKHIGETGDVSDISGRVEHFIAKTFSNSIDVNGNEADSAYFGAAYAYYSEYRNSDSARQLFLDVYAKSGFPAPPNRQVWRIIIEALRKLCEQVGQSEQAFIWLYNAYKKNRADEKYKAEIKDLLCEYSATADMKFYYRLVHSVKNIGSDGDELYRILASTFWKDAIGEEKALSSTDEAKAQALLDEYADNIYSAVFFWLNLANSMTHDSVKCPNTLKERLTHLTASEAKEFVGLFIGDGGASFGPANRSFLSMCKIFNCSEKAADLFDGCPEAAGYIFKKFFEVATMQEIGWDKYSGLYNKAKTNDAVLQWARSAGVNLNAPQTAYAEEQKIIQQAKQAEEARRRAEEAIRRDNELKQQEDDKKKRAESQRGERTREKQALINDSIDTALTFGNEVGYSQHDGNARFQNDYVSGKPETEDRHGLVAFAALLIIFSAVLIGVFWLISVLFAYTVGGSVGEYISKVWVVWLIGYIVFIAYLVYAFKWAKNSEPTEDEPEEKRNAGSAVTLYLKNIAVAAAIAVMFVLAGNIIAALICL